MTRKKQVEETKEQQKEQKKIEANNDDEKAEILVDTETPKDPKDDDHKSAAVDQEKIAKKEEEIKEEEEREETVTEEATPEVIHLSSDHEFVTKGGAIVDENNENEEEEANVDVNDDESVSVHRPESPKEEEARRQEYGKYKLHEKNDGALFSNSDTADGAAKVAGQPNIVNKDPQKSEHTSIKMLVQNNHRKRAAVAKIPPPNPNGMTVYNQQGQATVLRNFGSGNAGKSGNAQRYNANNRYQAQNAYNSVNRGNYCRPARSFYEPLNAPKPSYTPFRSVAKTASANQAANAQKSFGQRIRRGPTFDEDVICWAFNSFLGCPNGANCQWVHECYDTSKESGFDVCWTYNTEAGCRYGNECEWRHDRHPNKWRTIRKSR